MGITDSLVQVDQDEDHIWRTFAGVLNVENVVWSPTQDKNCRTKHRRKEFTAVTTTETK